MTDKEHKKAPEFQLLDLLKHIGEDVQVFTVMMATSGMDGVTTEGQKGSLALSVTVDLSIGIMVARYALAAIQHPEWAQALRFAAALSTQRAREVEAAGLYDAKGAQTMTMGDLLLDEEGLTKLLDRCPRIEITSAR